MQRKVYGCFVLMLLLAIYGLVGEMGYKDAQVEHNQYCSMVDAYKHDPDTGWPDYKHIYKAECGQQVAQP
jgi:hypothetical protein